MDSESALDDVTKAGEDPGRVLCRGGSVRLWDEQDRQEWKRLENEKRCNRRSESLWWLDKMEKVGGGTT